ncbi:MAG: hypothetical protein FWE74_03540 [Oscillospiraceae bacterium]|nr:hypothetical protein [Oscillospiraceae bacterium]
MKKARLIISIISVVLLVLVVIQLFIDNSNDYFFDSIGGEDSSYAQKDAVTLLISVVSVFAAVIINFAKGNTESRSLFVIISLLFASGFIFSLLTSFSRFGLGATGVIFTASNLICTILIFALAIKTKN